MTNNGGGTNGESGDDEPEFERRRVLSGIGGVMAGGAILDWSGGRASRAELADRWASRFGDPSTANEHAELKQLFEEMHTDAEILGNRDVADLDAASQREFAAKGRRFRELMAGECGYEGYEVWGGPYDGCCGAHDTCEGENDEPDHVFNGDDCDKMFWSCVATITAIM